MVGYKNAPPQRVLGLNHRNKFKIFKNLLLQNHLLQMFEIWFVALPVVFYQVCSNQGSRVQNGLAPGAPGFEA